MGSEILIDTTSHETRVALLENGSVTELYVEREKDKGIVGNIYKGIVTKILPGMQAAFVDLGLRRAGFLYVADVEALDGGESLETLVEDEPTEEDDKLLVDKRRPGRRLLDSPIEELLQEGQDILVQVSKEPIGTKGARLTSYITLPGRYLVFMPMVDHIGVSRRIVNEEERQRLKIAIVGFGNFGQFLARTFARQGHTLLAHSRTDHSALASTLGASFFTDPHDLCECHPDVVLLATSILSAEAVLRSLPVHRLRRNTLFVDVLSVKEFPRNLLLSSLPPDFDVICTHPMFGPESARDGWDGLPFVFDKVRVGDCPARRARAEAFLNIFEREGCRMVEMSCAEHDAHAAETQFLTHTVGRMLAMLELRSTPINTKGYETLLRLVDNTCSDSFDLYNGLFMYNKNSTELLNRVEWAMDSVKKKLFDGLHDVLRKQLFEGSPHAPNVSSSNVRK